MGLAVLEAAEDQRGESEGEQRCVSLTHPAEAGAGQRVRPGPEEGDTAAPVGLLSPGRTWCLDLAERDLRGDNCFQLSYKASTMGG